jgi:hypothetical protein
VPITLRDEKVIFETTGHLSLRVCANMAGDGKGGDGREERHNGKSHGTKKREAVLEKTVKRCWVYRRKDENAPWQRYFAVLDDGQLKTFKDDKVYFLTRSQLALRCAVLINRTC